MADEKASAGHGPAEHNAGHGTTASVEAGGSHHAEPASFGIIDATVWVSLSMAVFIAILLWRKVPALVARGLDAQIAAIRQRLDEASSLRAEAEALRDEYAARIATAESEADAMVARAETEAKALIAQAKTDAVELVARRTKMAEDKIAAAERAAISEVRTRAAELAARAAAGIIADTHDAKADKALVDSTIAGLSRLN